MYYKDSALDHKHKSALSTLSKFMGIGEVHFVFGTLGWFTPLPTIILV